MWIDRLTASRTTHAIELAAQFAEQRHKVLAENIANVDTPDYATKRLDPAAFEASLKEALERGQRTRARRLELRGNAQFAPGPDGHLRARPVEEPAANVLFHDGTNVRLERLLADVAQNGLSYEVTTSFLRGRFQSLLRAIRGRVE
ncbi:MAG: flagellar basal body rod protein FlgB [Planctomycetota bacterium]